MKIEDHVTAELTNFIKRAGPIGLTLGLPALLEWMHKNINFEELQELLIPDAKRSDAPMTYQSLSFVQRVCAEAAKHYETIDKIPQSCDTITPRSSASSTTPPSGLKLSVPQD